MTRGLLKDPDQFKSKPETKQCPYCVETIKAEAIVCRFCGKDLLRDAEGDQQIIGSYIARKSSKGWQVLVRSETGVQFKKPKRVNGFFLALGLILLIAWGAGLIILLLVILDYLFQKEQILFVTIEDIKLGMKPAAKPAKHKDDTLFIIVFIIVIVLLIGFVLFALFVGNPFF